MHNVRAYTVCVLGAQKNHLIDLWTELYAMILHVISYRFAELFSVSMHLILIAFWMILIVYLRKYTAYLYYWPGINLP